MKRVSTIIGLVILAVTMFVAAPARGLQIFTVKAPTAPCTPPPAGLMAWWPAAGNTTDIIGGNNAVLMNGAGYAGGEVGTGFGLSGYNDYVLVTSSNLDLGLGSGITIEGWINPVSTGNPMPILCYENGLGSFNGSDLGVYFYISILPPTGTGSGCLVANIQDTDNRNNIISSAPGVITPGVWQHVAVSYDKASGIAALYLNGTMIVQTNLGSFTPQTSFPDVLLGGHTTYGSAANPSEKFTGRLDEISLYNRALSSNEIAAVHAAGSGGKCAPQCVPPPDGLMAWWLAEGNTTDIISGNNAVLMNGASYTGGKVGSAFDLGGNNSYVLANSPNLDVGQGGGITIEGWINPASTAIPMPILCYENGLGSFNGPDLGVYFYISILPPTGTGSGCLVGNVEDTDNRNNIISSVPGVITSGVWQHVALSYDKASGMAALYLNGTMIVQTNLGSFTPQTSFPDVLLGGHTTYGSAAYPSEKFTGRLDEISLYNRALSSNEVAAIYGAGSAGKCTGNLPPLIVTPPASQTVVEGGEADLSVTAIGAGPLSYQWIFNGKNLAGATGTALSLPNIHPNQAGNYSVKVTGANGSVTSAPAVITVITQNILIYNYSGNEKITTLGTESSYGFSGQLFFIPDTTNAVFVGWSTINKKKQYWVSQVSDYLWIKVGGTAGHTYTVLGKAGTLFDGNGRPNIWSFFHEGQNANLPIAAAKTFLFPNTFAFSDTQVYPDTQTGNMILREAASNYSFVQNSTQTANNTGQTVADLVAAQIKSLVKQGYQPQ